MNKKQVSTLIIQRKYKNSERWFDLTTLGDTLDEVREELQEVKYNNLEDEFRIVQRVITTEDFVLV